MKCYHCEHYDNKTGICDCDGKVVISPGSDGECDYLKEKPTVFEKITASPEVLAEKLVYVTYHELPFDRCVETWHSTLSTMEFKTKAEAIAATVAKLNEVCDE